ncbi:MAG TPA: DUF255 domain-containing protein [Saprospiraceae bacterium]|nr:DUF255 domain-containing protein [Saprospiraceae bacterium]
MNKLKHSVSPYLKQHAQNPVHWWEWGHEAIDYAKQNNLPILISVGYSTCHWCHVMAHESFEDNHVAEIMNQHFVSIKVDREEYPELDHFLMTAVQSMGVSGGWPLNCFLTPEVKPFFGGTYFPPVANYGRPSWSQVLLSVARSFHEKKDAVVHSSNQIFEFISKQKTNQEDENNKPNLSPKEALKPYMDLELGGFGFGQKFPNTFALNLLMKESMKTADIALNSFIDKTVEGLCFCGMFDHLDGGFFRYTVDRNWRIPHFEKMLYDHCYILIALSQYYRVRRSYSILKVIEQAILFWEKSMSEEGLFYAAIDADSEGKEGVFYLWNERELEEVFDKNELEEILSLIDLVPMHGATDKVLNLKYQECSILSWNKQQWNRNGELLAKLAGRRASRLWPAIDKKQILAWNALAVSMYSSVYLSTAQSQYFEKANQLLETILKQFRYEDSSFARYCFDTKKYGHAYLEDLVYLIRACLDIYCIAPDSRIKDHVIHLFHLIQKDFSISNGLLSVQSNSMHSKHIPPLFDSQDSSLANPNAVLMQCKTILNHLNWEGLDLSWLSMDLSNALSWLNSSFFAHANWYDVVHTAEQIFISVHPNKLIEFLGWQKFYPNWFLLVDHDIDEEIIQICDESSCKICNFTEQEFENWILSN